jgi:hypothetical protein
MKEGKQRQAEHAQRLKQLGLRQIAVWVSDTESWMVAQASTGAKADRLDMADDYIAGLVDRSRQALVDSFLAVPGKMALFETEKDERRKAIGVKVFAFRTLPVLATQIMTADTTWRELADAHPLLEQTTTLGHYHWDTPSFRAACDALELDPDIGRPRFRPPYETLAEELLHGVAARFDEKPDEGHPLGFTTEIMLDVLDLMRADLRPSPSLLNRARRHWPKINQARLPRPEELTRLVSTDELLHISSEQHLVNDDVGMQHAVIDFLPSRHGAGYSATISGFFGEYEADGWVAGAYADLRGIAVEPDSERLEGSAWLRVVRRRLPEQGVIFIPREKVADYLETEGVFWIDRWGGTGRWRDARTPSWGERLMWRLKPPPLLVDRELALRELARRGSTGAAA